MNRTFSPAFALVLIALLHSVTEAQVMVSPALQAPKQEAKPRSKVLVLHAADQPDPLLRYRLWPAPEHRRDENPAPLVSRALILALQLPQETRKELDERFTQWSEISIAELPLDEVRKLLGNFSHALNELERAENLMRIEYNLQLDELSASEMVQTVLPELQEMRMLGRLLCLRARVAIAEKRWDDVAADCRLGFRLAEFAGRSTEFLIGRLVGFAISGLMMNIIEEAIQQPECPNLYWALASLPADRLVETRDALEFESALSARIFNSVGPLPDDPIGEFAAREKIRKLVREANLILSFNGDGTASSDISDLLAGIYVVTLAEPSRDLLASTSAWGQRARELSAEEAVLRASQLRFARIRDRWVAWSMLPPEVWDEYEAERKAAFGIKTTRSDVMESLTLSLLAPSVDAARGAGLRTHQQLNLLIGLEALRMHAASQGELPLSTDKLRPVPVGEDAITAKPFGYQRISPTKATLTRRARWAGDPETNITIELKGTK